MSSAYIVQFILTPREVDILRRKLKLSCLPDAEALKTADSRDSGRPRFVRQTLRLFGSVYLGSALVNALLRARSKGAQTVQIDGPKLAAALTIVGSGYRVAYNGLSCVADNAPLPAAGKGTTRKVLKVGAPILSAILASSGFRLLPARSRNYVALYLATKAAEYVYNALDDKGYFDWKPRLFGSWILFPIALSQLFYTLIVEPEACPAQFRSIMLSLAGAYHPERPLAYPSEDPWPTDNELLASVSEISRLKFPKFTSPILMPQALIPTSLLAVEPILSMANPSNTTLIGALLHPQSGSDWQPFLETVLNGYASCTKYLLPLYVLLGYVRNKHLSAGLLASSLGNTLRTATFVAMTAASAWGGIGLSQTLLGRKMLPATRFRVIGFMSGLWAFLDQVNGRTRYLYTLRLAILSQYNLLVIRNGGKPLIKNGGAALTAISFAVIFTLFNAAPESISSSKVRKICNWMQRGEYVDPAPLPPRHHDTHK